MTGTDRTRRRRRLYRSRHGILLGVCRGLADYFEVSPFWVRLAAVLALPFGVFWSVVLGYLIAAFLMAPEPVMPFRSDTEADFYSIYAESRGAALQRLRTALTRLEERLRRIESVVTSRGYQWEQRFRG